MAELRSVLGSRPTLADGIARRLSALRQTQLDYSDESLGRLDRLLASIRERARPSREVLQESVSGRNFRSLSH